MWASVIGYVALVLFELGAIGPACAIWIVTGCVCAVAVPMVRRWAARPD